VERDSNIFSVADIASQALKRDVIRSIIARCELLCEDLLQAEEEQGRLTILFCFETILIHTCLLTRGLLFDCTAKLTHLLFKCSSVLHDWSSIVYKGLLIMF